MAKSMHQKGFSKLIVAVIAALLIVVSLITVVGFSQQRNLAPSQIFPQVDQSDKSILAALGASTTKANNLSARLVGDHPEYSSVTGTKVTSLLLYLKSQGEDLEPVNLAESGADSQDLLDRQVPNAVSMYPKYITIDIVADIFDQDQPTTLRENLTEIATQLKETSAIIMISTYPNLAEMRKATFLACGQDKLGISIDKVTESKIRLFNQAIKDVAAEHNLILVDNFQTLGPSDVSDYDCLHPNIEGQQKLAQKWIEALQKGGDRK